MYDDKYWFPEIISRIGKNIIELLGMKWVIHFYKS